MNSLIPVDGFPLMESREVLLLRIMESPATQQPPKLPVHRP